MQSPLGNVLGIMPQRKQKNTKQKTLRRELTISVSLRVPKPLLLAMKPAPNGRFLKTIFFTQIILTARAAFTESFSDLVHLADDHTTAVTPQTRA